MLETIDSALPSLLAHTTIVSTTHVVTGLSRALRGRRRTPLSSETLDQARSRLRVAFESLDLEPLGVRPATQEALADYLVTPEFALLLNHLTVFELSGRSDELDRLAADELKSALARHTPLTVADDPFIAALLTFFRRLIRDLLDSIFPDETKIDDGAKDDLRRTVVEAQITAIEQHLRTLSQRTESDFGAYSDFCTDYQRVASIRYSTIVPPSLEDQRRVPIDDLYVPPNLLLESPSAADRSSRSAFLPVTEFIDEFHRAVVLGDPGAGKSTLAIKTARELLSGCRCVAPNSETTILPFIVVLREYGAHREDQGGSIVQYLERTIEQKDQVTAPGGCIDWLLASGRAAVIFDGMDELLDTSFRQEVTSSIEAFGELYPSAPIFVTTRRVGYQQAPLDPMRFNTFGIDSFESEQAEKYASNWFALDRSLSDGERTGLVEAFMLESEVVKDLRANPLMLGLMCTIYRGERYIPSNRPDIYEKCAVMLFDRWDKGRGIKVPLTFESHVRPAMQDLAFWIYGDPGLEEGVGRDGLIARATEFLNEWRFDDRHEARSAASEFIDFCRGRAWVFSDTGTTASGDPIYQFTHRTFLEYFAAAHLVYTNETTSKLVSFLAQRIRRAEWDVVAQLAVQMRSKQEQGAADKILGSLLKSADRKNGSLTSKINLVDFSARTLDFLVPSRDAVRSTTDELTRLWIELAVQEPIDELNAVPAASPSRELLTTLNHLLTTPTENLDTACSEVARHAATLDPNSRAFSCLMGQVVTLALNRPSPHQAIFAQAVEDNIERLRLLHGTELWSAVTGVWLGHIKPSDVAALHGVESLLRGDFLPAAPLRYLPISEVALRSLANLETPISAESRVDLFETLGPAIANGEIRGSDLRPDTLLEGGSPFIRETMPRNSGAPVEPLSPRLRVLAGLVAAVTVESRDLGPESFDGGGSLGELEFFRTYLARRAGGAAGHADPAEDEMRAVPEWEKLDAWSNGSSLLN